MQRCCGLDTPTQWYCLVDEPARERNLLYTIKYAHGSGLPLFMTKYLLKIVFATAADSRWLHEIMCNVSRQLLPKLDAKKLKTSHPFRRGGFYCTLPLSLFSLDIFEKEQTGASQRYQNGSIWHKGAGKEQQPQQFNSILLPEHSPFFYVNQFLSPTWRRSHWYREQDAVFGLTEAWSTIEKLRLLPRRVNSYSLKAY